MTDEEFDFLVRLAKLPDDDRANSVDEQPSELKSYMAQAVLTALLNRKTKVLTDVESAWLQCVQRASTE